MVAIAIRTFATHDGRPTGSAQPITFFTMANSDSEQRYAESESSQRPDSHVAMSFGTEPVSASVHHVAAVLSRPDLLQRRLDGGGWR
jgi:hypothetical protein